MVRIRQAELQFQVSFRTIVPVDQTKASRIDSTMYSHTELLDRLLQAQALLILAYFISACVVGGNSFAGFNALLLGIIFSGFAVATYYGLKKYPTRLHFGIILGGASILLFMSLQSAIFWGQYADCESHSRRVLTEEVAPLAAQRVLSSSFDLGPECRNISAMKSVCTFSVFMFLSYISQIWHLVHFKNDILVAAPPETDNYSTIPTFNKLPSAPASPSAQPSSQIK